MIKYLPLHEHIDNFNKSIEFTRSLGDSTCYVNFTEDYENNLIPISYGTGLTRAVVDKRPTKHKYEGGCKVRKDFYIDQLHRDCVYILYDDDEIVYVGQSKNVYNRLNQHIRDKEFDRVRYLHCREDRKLYWEKVLTTRYQPKYNKHK